jgi:prophage DNA circulation protein
VIGVVLGVLGQISPPQVEKEDLDASVRVAMDEMVDRAQDKIDRRVDEELSHLRDLTTERLAAVKDAVGALKDLTLEKMARCEATASGTSMVLQELRTADADVQERVKKLEKALTDLQKLFGD